MSKRFSCMDTAHREFILRQQIFFTASASTHGRVNVSPKDVAALRILGGNMVAYLDLTGSGNETAAHLRAHPRLTLMFCAFNGPPMILRLYGHGRILHRRSPEYVSMLASEFEDAEPPGARQIVVLDVDLVQTSCGYGVPLFEYAGKRHTLIRWAEAKGDEELGAYRYKKNSFSIDGLPTGLSDEPDQTELP